MGSIPKELGDLKFQATIGDGAFSVVKLAKNLKTGKYSAVKIVPKARLNSQNLEIRFETEIRVNQQLHHPGIVEMQNFMSDSSNYYIVMEFCPNGELFQHIIDQGHLNDSEAQPIFYQLLDSINYIHSMGVSHRDLKPENLLFDNFGRIKISDFGLSRFVSSENLVATPCGSPCYASPECLSGRPYNGITSDMWSCGVILYAMLTGQLPWTKRNQTELFRQIRSGDYTIPNFVSPEGKALIQGLMTVNISKRLTAEQALAQPFFNGVTAQYPHPFLPRLISLKRVDMAFAKQCDMSSLKDIPKKANKSTPAFSLKKTTKLIKNKKSHKKGEKTEEHKHHHHHHKHGKN